MKILHLLNSSHFSGAENVVCQIINMFKDDDNIEMVYCSRDGQIREALCERNIDFVPITDLTVKEVKRVIREVKPDVVHAHDMRASFIASIACGKTKLISHIHNSDFRSRKISIKSVLYLLAAPKISNVIWVSNSCFENYCFSDLFSKKSTILYNVINKQDIENRANQDINCYGYDVVFVGRLANPKNPVRLLKIIEIAKRKYPNIKVGIAGTGDLEEIAHVTAHELGLEDNVDFLGFFSNPMKLLQSSKLMVMTSDREGLPMVALEAMALGVPIVSTPTDGLCDIVDHDITGYLENDNELFAKRIVEIISNPELRMRLSRNTLKKFDSINDVDTYKGILNGFYRENR